MANCRFNISVKDVNGNSYVVGLEPSWSVDQLKQEVSRLAVLPPDSFELVFAGSVIKGRQTLSVRKEVDEPFIGHCGMRIVFRSV